MDQRGLALSPAIPSTLHVFVHSVVLPTSGMALEPDGFQWAGQTLPVGGGAPNDREATPVLDGPGEYGHGVFCRWVVVGVPHSHPE